MATLGVQELLQKCYFQGVMEQNSENRKNTDSEAERAECFWDAAEVFTVSSLTTVANSNLKLNMFY